MSPGLAPTLTKAASRQTYYTIRFLVDRRLRQDAFRAYAYFRWVDDVLDADLSADPAMQAAQQLERRSFLERQGALLDRCLRGDAPQAADPHEAMLIELVQHAGPDRGLEAYLRHMMLVMDFDVRRRGRPISQAELNDYTAWLATAVTEAMRYFIGHGTAAPEDETRYLAASGAHIMHMLRDTFEDLQAGYFNVPLELLEAHSIGPGEVDSDAYRAWVSSRVTLARALLDGGRSYFARVQSRRHRLAGLAYIARFEWLGETLEREGFRLRPRYDERRSLAAGLRMSWLVISSLAGLRGGAPSPSPIGRPQGGRT